ncbi:MAG: hypothetical protein ACRBBP_07235 [Bdellovibrionales bacterium]
MRKYGRLSLILPLILLCSCEIFGWDSSGGNNCDGECQHSDIEADTAFYFFLEAPATYPFSGAAEVTTTDEGDIIYITGTELNATSDLNTLSHEDALIVVQKACDSTATTINSITVTTDATVNWTNSTSDILELTISDATMGTDGHRLIECLEP